MKKAIRILRKSYALFVITGLTMFLMNWLTDFKLSTGAQIVALLFITFGVFVESIFSIIEVNKEDKES